MKITNNLRVWMVAGALAVRAMVYTAWLRGHVLDEAVSTRIFVMRAERVLAIPVPSAGDVCKI